MKRHNSIDIIAHFQRKHALQEEREMNNLPAAPNGTAISVASDKNGVAQKGIFENEHVRVSTMSVPKGTNWSLPHDGRDRAVVLLDKMNRGAETNGQDSFSSSAWRLTWIPANSEVNATNTTDQTKNLLILEFKDTAAEEALVRPEAPSPKASQ